LIPYLSILCCLRFNLLLPGLHLLELILHTPQLVLDKSKYGKFKALTVENRYKSLKESWNSCTCTCSDISIRSSISLCGMSPSQIGGYMRAPTTEPPASPCLLEACCCCGLPATSLLHMQATKISCENLPTGFFGTHSLFSGFASAVSTSLTPASSAPVGERT
jgi:hypothetical protein